MSVFGRLWTHCATAINWSSYGRLGPRGGASGRGVRQATAAWKRVMRIVITGNLGYIGGVVTRGLRAAYTSAFIIGFDAGYFSHCLTTPLPESKPDVQYYGDIRSFPSHLLDGTD